MMVSERELELSDEHSGIIELPAKTKVGSAAAKALGLDDAVFDIAITPNRPDCLGVRGVARDLAAAGLGQAQEEHGQAGQRRLRQSRSDQARIRQGRGERLPDLRWSPGARRQERAQPRVAATAPARDRASSHQRAGRYHQLHLLRPGAAAPRLRRRQAHRRDPRAARQDGREVRSPRRQDLRGGRDDVRHRRRGARARPWRRDGRRGDRLHRGDDERLHRVRPISIRSARRAPAAR